MKTLTFAIEVAATTAKTAYLAVPCRGTIAGVEAVYNQETDADEIFTLYRATDAVLTITPTDALAAGTVIDGVLDTTNGSLIFDSESTTITDKVIKVGILNTVDTAGVLALTIKFDDSAYVKQAALEA